MCDIYGEFSDVWDKTIVTARKEHQCWECDLPIPVGCRHERIGSLYDGHWSTFRVHLECERLAQIISIEYCGAGGAWMIGSLYEEIAEYERETTFTLEDDTESDCEVVIEVATGRPLHGPGHLHGALAAIRARYATASPSA